MFGREFIAVYLGVNHFWDMLEGRTFSVSTDHKPLTYAFKSEGRIVCDVSTGYPHPYVPSEY